MNIDTRITTCGKRRTMEIIQELHICHDQQNCSVQEKTFSVLLLFFIDINYTHFNSCGINNSKNGSNLVKHGLFSMLPGQSLSSRRMNRMYMR